MKIKKHLVVSFCAMLAFLMAATVFCPKNVYAANEKQQIQTTIKKVMNAAKKLDDRTVYKYIQSSDAEQMKSIKQLRKQSAFGELNKITPSAYLYIKESNKKISYKVASTSIKGNKATVKLKVKFVNSKKVADNLVNNLSSDLQSEEFVNQVNSLDSVLNMSTFFTNYSESLFAKSVVRPNKMKNKTITLVMKKVKGKWMITDENTNGFEAFGNILYADLIKSLENTDTTGIDYSKIDVQKLMTIIMTESGMDASGFTM